MITRESAHETLTMETEREWAHRVLTSGTCSTCGVEFSERPRVGQVLADWTKYCAPCWERIEAVREEGAGG